MKVANFKLVVFLNYVAFTDAFSSPGRTQRIVSHSPLGLRTSLQFKSPVTTSAAALGYESSSLKFPQKSSTQCNASAVSTSNGSSPSAAKTNIITVASTALLITLDVSFRKLLKSLSISFPSSLAGCGALFATLLAAFTIKEEWGDGLYEVLKPGAGLLAKWLPVFFVPSLVTLPLAQSLGSGLEILKVATAIVAGFFFTLFSTAYSVIAVRKLSKTSTDVPTDDKEEETAVQAPTPAPKAFSDTTSKILTTTTILTTLVSTIVHRAIPNVSPLLTTPLQTLTMLSMTLSSFVFGARLPKSFTKLVHPLVTCTSLTWVGSKLLTLLYGGSKSFTSMLQSYKVGSLCPVHLGAGDILLFMLGPAVVALACQMYDRKQLMKENTKEVGTAIAVSSLGGLFGTATMVRLLSIVNPTLRLCLLSRNITSPLAMAIAGILGADVSLAVSMVVITGLIGANFGASILSKAGIVDPVARGMGIGAAAHGLGTAAFAGEKDAFPFAAIGMALTASACTVLVSVPAVKALVLKIALGI
jgi:putative effector of murein hydrolase/putative effector of murein hydrolase LrgA (UPF0299 family)